MVDCDVCKHKMVCRFRAKYVGVVAAIRSQHDYIDTHCKLQDIEVEANTFVELKNYIRGNK